MVTKKFCKCIKALNKKGFNEASSIAICVKSVLQTKGKTLKKFRCGRKGRIITQKMRK